MRRSTVSRVLRSIHVCLTVSTLLLVADGCVRKIARPSPQQVQSILTRGGPFAESSFYSCLLSGYYQGLPLGRLQAKCETDLAIDADKGFGGGGGDFGSLGPGPDAWFDPASVSTACNSGNPTYAGPDGSRRHVDFFPGGKGGIDYGYNTWGGKDSCNDSGCYEGLSEEESDALKEAAIQAARDAIADAKAANDAANKDPDDAEKKKAAAEAVEKAQKAIEEAKKDPNKKKPLNVSDGTTPSDGTTGETTGRPSGQGASACDEALRAAREILRECQRVGWKGGRCEQLKARMHGCADPMISFIDPESGYTCGEPMDAEALKDAYVARCRQVTRPDPDGPDPCVPPSFESSGRYAHQGPGEDMCNSLIAIVDPESPQCLVTVSIPRHGRTLQEVLLVGLNKIGGPIVVLPTRDPHPSPNPGPDPRPGPNP